MSTKVLIVVPPVRLSQPPLRFPLGLGYIAAVLEEEGIDLTVLDLNMLRLAPGKEREALRQALNGVSLVATGGMITMFATITRLADTVKNHDPGIPVVVGGPIGRNLQEVILRNSSIDVLVSGEGERVITPLVKALENGGDLTEIAGLSYLEQGEFRQTSSVPRIENLDQLPMPAYHQFPFSRYLQNRNGDSDIIGSRGCPFRCTFCFRNFGNKVHFRSLDNIMEEIVFLRRFYNLKHIHLEDELFVQKRAFIMDFCDRVLQLGGFPWSACARVNTLTFDTLKRMKEANCRWIMLGLESFDAGILEQMNKGVSPEQNHQVCEWMNELGMEIRPGLMIGMPGETEESIQRTVEGCIRHKIPLNRWNYAFATPYPGTELYSEARQRGLIRDELEFIRKLSEVGDTCDLTLNLTSFSDRKLASLRDNAIQSVNQNLEKSRSIGNPIPIVRHHLGRLKRSIISRVAPPQNPLSVIRRDHLRKGMTPSQTQHLLRKTLKMVEVEVFSYCNRACWYCPNAFIDRRSENIFMDEVVFEKILRNLSQIDYAQKISFSRYNEPLADSHILTCLRRSRELVPNSVLHLNTNGDYLTPGMLEDLSSAGLNSLNIQVYLNEEDYSDHQASKQLFKKIESLELPSTFSNSRPGERLEYLLHFKEMQIRIYTRNFKLNGTDRGATIPELAKDSTRTSPCLIPFIHMYIDYNGKVVPCCNIRSDVPEHKSYVLGDLSQQDESLFSIMSAEKALQWRRHLYGDWEKMPPCDSCSFQELPDDQRIRAIVKKLARHT